MRQIQNRGTGIKNLRNLTRFVNDVGIGCGSKSLLPIVKKMRSVRSAKPFPIVPVNKLLSKSRISKDVRVKSASGKGPVNSLRSLCRAANLIDE